MAVQIPAGHGGQILAGRLAVVQIHSAGLRGGFKILWLVMAVQINSPVAHGGSSFMPAWLLWD